ncbi:hypothetical protein C9J85_07720 [Haloferax sp. wsp5]|nr:hypothetical protein C9J85_07720 [Haloferax sp. wsp5]
MTSGPTEIERYGPAHLWDGDLHGNVAVRRTRSNSRPRRRMTSGRLTTRAASDTSGSRTATDLRAGNAAS